MRNQKGEKDLTVFFEPECVAVIGSLSRGWFGGLAVLENLKKFGYPGKVFLVNPSHDRIGDINVYPNIKEVPEPVDLAIILTKAERVPRILRECVEAGVKGVIVGSDGFAERGGRGVELQREIVEIGKRSGVRILGPNTLGTVNTSIGFVPTTYTVAYSSLKKGGIALAAQTGIIGPQAMAYEDWGYGISKICDFGNKCDVDECDLLEYLAEDPETKVIAMHLEDVRNGRRFLEVTRKIVPKKPVLVYKPGKSEESTRALQSHTGSLAGNRRVYEAALRQAKVIQVNSFRELLEIPKAFCYLPLPNGNRVGIITLTGGAAVMAIDSLAESGLKLASFSKETLQALAEIDPSIASNPSDLGPLMARGTYPQDEVIEIVMNDPNVDSVLVITAVFFTKPIEIKELHKPVVFWVYGPSTETINEFKRELENMGCPVYEELEIATRALGALHQYGKIKNCSPPTAAAQNSGGKGPRKVPERF